MSEAAASVAEPCGIYKSLAECGSLLINAKKKKKTA